MGFIVWTLQAINYFDLVAEDGHGLKIYFYFTILNFPKIIQEVNNNCNAESREGNVFLYINNHEIYTLSEFKELLGGTKVYNPIISVYKTLQKHYNPDKCLSLIHI